MGHARKCMRAVLTLENIRSFQLRLWFRTAGRIWKSQGITLKQNSPQALPSYDPETGSLNVIVETPKGSRNKYKWDEKHELYTLSKILPCGSYFPYDFGFIPATLGEDGDPLDVLLLMEEPAFAGCLIPSRLIGVMKAEQDGERNDRLIAVCEECEMYAKLNALSDMPSQQMKELEAFFISYNRVCGKEFKILEAKGPKEAQRLVKDGEKRREKNGKGNGKQSK
jgi:inorganic pyrophosphatase